MKICMGTVAGLHTLTWVYSRCHFSLQLSARMALRGSQGSEHVDEKGAEFLHKVAAPAVKAHLLCVNVDRVVCIYISSWSM